MRGQLFRALAGQRLEVVDHVHLIEIAKLMRDCRPVVGRHRLPVNCSLEPQYRRVGLGADSEMTREEPLKWSQAKPHAVSECLHSNAASLRNHFSHHSLKPGSVMHPRNQSAEEPVGNRYPLTERLGFPSSVRNSAKRRLRTASAS